MKYIKAFYGKQTDIDLKRLIHHLVHQQSILTEYQEVRLFDVEHEFINLTKILKDKNININKNDDDELYKHINEIRPNCIIESILEKCKQSDILDNSYSNCMNIIINIKTPEEIKYLQQLNTSDDYDITIINMSEEKADDIYDTSINIIDDEELDLNDEYNPSISIEFLNKIIYINGSLEKRIALLYEYLYNDRIDIEEEVQNLIEQLCTDVEEEMPADVYIFYYFDITSLTIYLTPVFRTEHYINAEDPELDIDIKTTFLKMIENINNNSSLKMVLHNDTHIGNAILFDDIYRLSNSNNGILIFEEDNMNIIREDFYFLIKNRSEIKKLTKLLNYPTEITNLYCQKPKYYIIEGNFDNAIDISYFDDIDITILSGEGEILNISKYTDNIDINSKYNHIYHYNSTGKTELTKEEFEKTKTFNSLKIDEAFFKRIEKDILGRDENV